MLEPGDEFVHRAFLTAVFADSPFMAKFRNSIGSFTSYLACYFCYRTGVPVDGVMRYVGYAEPAVAQAGLHMGEAFQLGENDARFELTSLQQCDRANDAATAAADGLQLGGLIGCHGRATIPCLLDYVDLNHIWLVPFAHSFFYGVLKDFLATFVLADGQAGRPHILTRAQRDVLIERGMQACWSITPDFNRSYRCVIRSQSHYVMEEFARALLVFLPALFRELPGAPVLPDIIKEAFGHLRRFAEYHTWPVEVENEAERQERLQQARREILAYATLCEKVGDHQTKPGCTCIRDTAWQ
jgi:hypothetical protein